MSSSNPGFISPNSILSEPAVHEYNALDGETKYVTIMRAFKEKIKLKYMQGDHGFRAISPYYLVN